MYTDLVLWLQQVRSTESSEQLALHSAKVITISSFCHSPLGKSASALVPDTVAPWLVST